MSKNYIKYPTMDVVDLVEGPKFPKNSEKLKTAEIQNFDIDKNQDPILHKDIESMNEFIIKDVFELNEMTKKQLKS